MEQQMETGWGDQGTEAEVHLGIDGFLDEISVRYSECIYICICVYSVQIYHQRIVHYGHNNNQ